MALFNYCGRCGKNNLINKEIMYQCPDCGLETYLNPKPTSCALVVNGNRVLIAQRARNPFKGSWGLPGGFMENGETFEDCVLREVKEELGLDLVNPKYFASVYNGEYLYGQENYTNICCNFVLQVQDEDMDKVVVADDVSDYRFITREELGQYEFCFKIDKILEQYFDDLNI